MLSQNYLPTDNGGAPLLVFSESLRSASFCCSSRASRCASLRDTDTFPIARRTVGSSANDDAATPAANAPNTTMAGVLSACQRKKYTVTAASFCTVNIAASTAINSAISSVEYANGFISLRVLMMLPAYHARDPPSEWHSLANAPYRSWAAAGMP